MPVWLEWTLIGIAAAGAVLGMLLNRILRSRNEQRFQDKYDPVRLQREEAMYVPAQPPHKT